MLKTVKLALNEFPDPPLSLLIDLEGTVASAIEVNLGDLYHHYYLDSWGVEPPSPDPANFEHVQFLLPCEEFRFTKQGLGIAKTFKGHKSNELGQAFCRWFMSEHLDIDYIAHIEHVRDHAALADDGGISINTSAEKGDRPDYFCASGSNKIFLAEAKGTTQAVGFQTKQFQTWRDQFDRVEVLDAYGNALKVKGYIVAMRWATELDSAKIATTLAAEDPETRGEFPVSDDRPGLAYATKSIHYASSLQRLRQPVISAALMRGSRIPAELQFRVVLWECLLPGLEKMKFVGGYFPGRDGSALPFEMTKEGKLIHNPPHPLRLDVVSGTFFGIEEKVFRTLVDTARNGPGRIAGLRPLDRPQAAYSGLSLLADGHVVGPVELFRPIGALLV
ncbi:MAG TPA: hypothetical protein VIP08_19290 [Phenylobacterium sp.]|uniref:hypothetical protein n=1 Tax=Phenylobacterium sp. TaxID=1871053 RepID=UPI002F935316